jgi:tRNA1Val (adenine37-N6)-methyltransferase
VSATTTDQDASPSDVPVDEDALFLGAVTLYQPAKGFGYRTNVDALLLAAFACSTGRAARLAIDLGAGVGAVGLSLLHWGAARRVEFVERDPFAAELCRRNVRANGWADVAAVTVGNLRHSLRALSPALLHRADLVVANPPYFSAPARVRPGAAGAPSRDEARHGDLEPFLRAAVEAMGRRSKLCIVHPAAQLLSTMTQARDLALVPKRLRFVHGRPGRPARIALLELALARDGGLVVEPALVEFDDDQQPLPELSRLLAGSPEHAANLVFDDLD